MFSISRLFVRQPYFSLHKLSVLSLLVSICFINACSSPEKSIIRKNHWRTSYIETSSFTLTQFSNNIQSNTLHIYIGGDGTPWIQGRYISKDPTPRNPLTLKLMAQESSEAVYIARPCYYLSSPQKACNEDLWTFGRYSETVVATLTEAVKRLIHQNEYSTVRIIGFSGGGVLATLIAERVPEVNHLITIAANLDTQLWATRLQYLPLTRSINPTDLKALRPGVRRTHLLAKNDKSVPNAVTESFINKHGGETRYFSDFDHHCCWHKNWAELLQQLSLSQANKSLMQK